MTDQSPAEELRAAAKLMRERAKAATPGPWYAHVFDDDCWFVSSEQCGQVLTPCHDPGPADFAMVEQDERDAQHFASWHPLVALAVADWLEATAEDAAGFLTLETPECPHHDCACDPLPVWGCDRCGNFTDGGGCTCWDAALKVARAYSGTAEVAGG